MPATSPDDRRPDTPPTPHRRLRDPRELQALAHPVRMSIIEYLSIRGPLTASELADLIDESPANCSWHLRKLAEHGFVEEAPGGTGRQRPWQMPGIGFWTDDTDATPTERRAMEGLDRMWLERHVDRLHDAKERANDELGEEWAETISVHENGGWMTSEELSEMRDEITTIMNRYHHRMTDPSSRPPGSRMCTVVAWTHPLVLRGLDATPESDD